MPKGGKRPGAGRKRVDPKLKALRGTTRKDRQLPDVADVSPAGAMICPAHLGDLEQLYFGSIVQLLIQQARASHHYTEHVAMLAIRLGQIQRYNAVIECEGDTYETRTSTGGLMIRARPEVSMLSDAMRHAHSLLTDIGLTPSSAQRLADSAKKSTNPFVDL